MYFAFSIETVKCLLHKWLIQHCPLSPLAGAYYTLLCSLHSILIHGFGLLGLTTFEFR